MLIAVPGMFKIGANTLCRLRVDRQRLAPSAFTHNPQRVKAPVLVQITDLQRGDLRATESHL